MRTMNLKFNPYIKPFAIALVFTTQALLALTYLASFIPHGTVDNVLRPEREVYFYALGIGLFFLLSFFCQRAWSTFFVVVEVLITGCWLSAKYKLIVYDYHPFLAQLAWWLMLVISVCHKVFATRIEKWAHDLWGWYDRHPNPWFWRLVTAGLFIFWLWLALDVPNLEAVVARMFIGEQFHHIDHFVMAAGHAYLKGCLPYVDVLSEYGVGLPVLLASLVKMLFGSFTYTHVVQLTVYAIFVYFVLVFVFTWRVYQSILVAMALTLLAFKWHCFYTMAYPLVLTYPSSTPLRNFFDILILWCLWQHLCKGSYRWLMAACVLTGVMIFYMTSAGIALTAALCVYLFISYWQKQTSLLKSLMALASIGLTAVFLLSIVLKQQLFNSLFWQHMKDFNQIVTGPYFTGPFWSTLYSHQFIDMMMALVFPMMYLYTILVKGSKCWQKQATAVDVLLIIVAIYGLGVYSHYVVLSSVNNYYTMAFPFVFCLGHWVNNALASFHHQWQRGIRLGLVMVTAYALMTMHLFGAYPNHFNLSANPMVDTRVALPLPDRIPYFNHKYYSFKEDKKVPVNNLGQREENILVENNFRTDADLIAYYRTMTDFSIDTTMIQKYYTREMDRVPLVASFETMMLMKANRKPFFYFFPLINSKPLDMRVFGIANIFTTAHLNSIINQMVQEKPPYVFLERLMLQDKTPAAYETELYGLMDILRWIKSHYTVVEQGQWLVALKRIDDASH